MVAGLLALSLLAAGPGGPDGAPQRYKIEVKQAQTIDLSAMGQGSQENGINATGFVTITMSDTAGGMIAHVVLDSMMIEASGAAAGQMPPFLADSAKGAIWHLYVVGGKIQGEPAASKEGPATALIQQGIGALFTPIKGMKVGDTWADTSNINNSSDDGGSTTGTTITTWTVDGLAGGVFTLSAKAEGTMSGEQQGGQMLMSGTTTSTAKVVSASGGPASSVGVESTQTMSITVPMADAPIPINGTTSVTVTPLP